MAVGSSLIDQAFVKELAVGICVSTELVEVAFLSGGPAADVAERRRLIGCRLGLEKIGDGDGSNNADDGHHDQEFYEAKSRRRVSALHARIEVVSCARSVPGSTHDDTESPLNVPPKCQPGLCIGSRQGRAEFRRLRCLLPSEGRWHGSAPHSRMAPLGQPVKWPAGQPSLCPGGEGLAEPFSTLSQVGKNLKFNCKSTLFPVGFIHPRHCPDSVQ